MAAGYAEAEKRRVEYAKVLNSYNQLMAAGYAEAEKPDKSRSEVDPSSDSKEGKHRSLYLFGISNCFQFIYK
uniref:High mobility group protein n=2 Tax=Solanum tuberosum TaxID=4113 RepID=M1BDX2_SOLTU